MSQVVIENPIINSPFDEPTRHFRFSDEGITNEIDNGRRTRFLFRPHRQAEEEGFKPPSVRQDTRRRRARHDPPPC